MKFLDATTPITQFSKMGLEPTVLASLAKLLITNPTEIQSRALPVAVAGKDLIAVAETGSGKTLGFVLPILNRLELKPSSRSLILVPTREMALQIFDVVQKLTADNPISSAVIIGGERDNKHNKELKKMPSLIVATPGRLNDLLRNNKLLLQGLKTLVIDEADVMLDMGFMPQLKEIHATLRGERQTLMFSASFNSKTETVAKLFMKSQEVTMIRSTGSEKPVDSLTQRVIFLAPGMKNQQMQNEINSVTGSVIVFTANQETCEIAGRYLREYAHKSDFVHGGLNQSVRTKVLDKFREGKTRILVTTDLLARGLDVPSLELVINFDLPPQPEDFVHRIGRTARMGRKGHAVTFLTPFDFRLYKEVKSFLAGAEEITLDPKFKFVGDVTSSVNVPRVQAKKLVKPGAPDAKKKKKYGKSNKKRI
jgi:ATP-dependent RNA helicase RhlE